MNVHTTRYATRKCPCCIKSWSKLICAWSTCDDYLIYKQDHITWSTPVTVTFFSLVIRLFWVISARSHRYGAYGAAHARARHWLRGVTEGSRLRGRPPLRAARLPRHSGIPSVTTTCPFMSLDMVGGHSDHMVPYGVIKFFSMEFCNGLGLL